jgi:DNA invertase Pin-like site-specific DNA recombinase
MVNILKAKLYARVSTDDKEQDPERQLLKLRQYCELNEHKNIGEVIDYDTGDSDPLKRENGKNLLIDDPDIIIFFSIDRFTRQHPTKVMNTLNFLKDNGVKFVSITEPAFNMESEFSEVILYLITWYNNYFLTKLKRDIKSGMDRAVKEGKHIGRAKATFNKDLAYKLLFENKMPQREAARLLNTSLSTINRFKKGIEKNDGGYILKYVVSESLVFET